MYIFQKIKIAVIEYRINELYTKRFLKYGKKPAGVFWKNSFTQNYRFELIYKEILKEHNLEMSIIADIGCGYGKLYEFLKSQKSELNFEYIGYDINSVLIEHCEKMYPFKNVNFFKLSCPREFVDFTIMSGTFNLCVLENLHSWEKYIIESLEEIWKKTKKIMLFNLLISNKRMILNKLYFSEKDWIRQICEKKFGKTRIIQDTLLPKDILVVISR